MSELAARFGVQLTTAQLEAVDALVAERNEGKEPHYSRWSRQRVLREAVDLYLAQAAPDPPVGDHSAQLELDVEEIITDEQRMRFLEEMSALPPRDVLAARRAAGITDEQVAATAARLDELKPVPGIDVEGAVDEGDVPSIMDIRGIARDTGRPAEEEIRDDRETWEQPDVEEAVEEAVAEGELRKRRAALYHVYSRALEDGCARRLTEPPVQPVWLAGRIQLGRLVEAEDFILRRLAQDPMNRDAVAALYRSGPTGVEEMKRAVRRHYGLPKLDLYCEEVERWLKGDQDASR